VRKQKFCHPFKTEFQLKAMIVSLKDNLCPLGPIQTHKAAV
jgi:hypothetical protein